MKYEKHDYKLVTTALPAMSLNTGKGQGLLYIQIKQILVHLSHPFTLFLDLGGGGGIKYIYIVISISIRS